MTDLVNYWRFYEDVHMGVFQTFEVEKVLVVSSI